jgi:hypothetical protein
MNEPNATPNATLQQLKAAWLAAKQAERAAAEERLAIEQAIVALLPSDSEGTVKDEESGVTVTYRYTRKVDTAAVQADWMRLPEKVQAAFRWSADVDTRRLKDLDPESFAIAAKYITTTPAKPTISLKD